MCPQREENKIIDQLGWDAFGLKRDITERGKIAFEMLQAEIYDSILVDLRMSVKNGFEATEYILTTMKSRILIIALTADFT